MNEEVQDFREFIGISAVASVALLALFAMLGYRGELSPYIALLICIVMAGLAGAHVRLWQKLGRYETEAEP